MKFTFLELTNPNKEDFTFMYDSVDYTVKAGKTELFPDFISKHGAKKMADKYWTAPLDRVGREKLEKSYLGNVVNPTPETPKKTLAEEVVAQREELKPEIEFEGLRDLLKKEADAKGIKYPKNIKTDKLKKLLNK